MWSRGIRFRPPIRSLDAAQRWALRRAFWPATTASGVADPGESLEAVTTLRLGRRIASRTPAHTLAAELGDAGAERLREERLAAVARSLLVRACLHEVLQVARRVGVAPVLLKVAALEAHGALQEGSRGASDVDLLLDEVEARALSRELLAVGWEPTGEREEEHHLPSLVRPGGVPIELHTRIPGVRLGDRSVDADGLEGAGLLDDALGEFVGARVPRRAVLVAHLLVHGIAQHGASPSAYPMLQPFADVIDLGWPFEVRADSWQESAIARATETLAPWVQSSLGRPLLEASAKLCARLAAGEPTLIDETSAASGEAVLLHHCVWGMADREYADSLRLQAIGPSVSDRSVWGARLHGVFRALAPSAGELTKIYGGRPSAWRVAWLRLYRPFDLFGRAVRTLWSRGRIRS